MARDDWAFLAYGYLLGCVTKSAFGSVDGAIALLERLTPDERERLARSGTVLAAFADVTTPQEAMARFESLDPQRRMEVITMFMRVQDG